YQNYTTYRWSVYQTPGRVRKLHREQKSPAIVATAPDTHLQAFHFGHEFLERVLRIAKQHPGFGMKEQFVLDTRVAGTHTPLEDDDIVRRVHIENGHPVDRTGWIGACGGIDYIIGADNEHDIGG